jgi:hypothetical protein
MATPLESRMNVCRAFSVDLEETLAGMAAQARWALLKSPITLFRLIKHHLQSRKARTIVRGAMEMCEIACDHADCLEGIHGNVALVRDNYLKVVSVAEKLPVASLLKPLLEEELGHWDDLVEDCVVGSSHEFRSFVNRISRNT